MLAQSSFAPGVRQVVTALHIPRWISNLTVLIPLVFARDLGNPALTARSLLALVLLCGLSGSVYIIDDLVDQRRGLTEQPAGPAATAALFTAVALALICLPVAFLLSRNFGLLTLAYCGLMVLYPLILKQMLLIDVLVLAAGLVLRTVAGAAAIDVPISPWLYVVTSALALFLALGQARHQLICAQGDHQVPASAEYSLELWEALTAVATAAVVMSYGLYTFFAESLPADHRMMLTIPFVLYFVFRYLFLLDRGVESGVPERIVLADVPLLADAALWGLATVLLLYV
ncbi:MAG: decaprenyl-phosphate phosphoribosyltransferase [Chloroflexi bacterium]|nr:decaprenyl-phosphate phosphoribosyltransferase [Chloroflexota bacterium]MBU1746212.1 decaprenyl-phosphate phosphoribosyltransferase [Chloroflexota bacterium]